jgi:F-type H+-transporting ATPase subunit k
MGSAYTILGRTVPAHQISIATLSAALLVALPNPFASKAENTPKIDASSPEEQKFIEEYLKKAENTEEKH